jgi:60 kDa SS-A/Ro ribonucleoprotein
MATNLTKHYQTTATPQSQPMPGKRQVKNSAGGYVFPVDDWKRFERFLVLGSEGGSYYASERTLTVANAEAVRRCILADGKLAVNLIVEVSARGRAPKNDQAIFALAMALKLGDQNTKTLARYAVTKVCRIGTHIFQLAETVKAFGGWGRATRAAFAGWYVEQDAQKLALNLIKYQIRNGWTHRDLMRKCHPQGSAAGQEHEALFRWVTQHGNLDARSVKRGERTDDYVAVSTQKLPKIIGAFEKMRKATTPQDAIALISEYGLPRETVPTELLNSPKVWEALLMEGNGMPFTAMIRNLGKMSSIGLLTPMSKAEKYIVSRLSDADGLRKARVHPIAILMAQSVYASGHGVRGSLFWTTSGRVTDALNDAFYSAFGGVEPTGKRWLLGVDVSGSMDSGSISGTHLTPRECAAAMALVTAKTEAQHHTMAFANDFVPLNITPKTRLDDAVRVTKGFPLERTNCALPMAWALKHHVPVDVFAIYTDSETWFGDIHPMQMLQQYRQRMGINAKLVVVGMVSNDFSIADPDDGGCLDVVGFDTATPQIISDFARA